MLLYLNKQGLVLESRHHTINEKFKKNSEKGFALPLALLLLVVMTIMGATLVNITSTEHNANTNKDSNQQTFYAAESGISVAKSWMVGNISKFSSSPPNNLDGQLRFCKASFFPNLRSSFFVKPKFSFDN